MEFVYVKVPARALAHGGDARLHLALDSFLTDRSAGSLLGWGASLGERDASGHRTAEHHRLDVEISDLAQGMAQLRLALEHCGVPPGTEIHCTSDDQPQAQVLGRQGWSALAAGPGA